MSNTRTETDSFDAIEVPASALWGPQTARSLHFFALGAQRMPLEVIHALAWIKWAAARVNADLKLLPAPKAQAIAAVALEVRARLQPSLSELHSALSSRAQAFKAIVKIGRIHQQDATPLTLEAALALGQITVDQFDLWADVQQMLAPSTHPGSVP